MPLSAAKAKASGNCLAGEGGQGAAAYLGTTDMGASSASGGTDMGTGVGLHEASLASGDTDMGAGSAGTGPTGRDTGNGNLEDNGTDVGDDGPASKARRIMEACTAMQKLAENLEPHVIHMDAGPAKHVLAAATTPVEAASASGGRQEG